jgi:hypothetical protein
MARRRRGFRLRLLPRRGFQRTLNRDDIPGYPGIPAPGQQHRDAPLSAKGWIMWWTVLGLIALGFVALILLTR